MWQFSLHIQCPLRKSFLSTLAKLKGAKTGSKDSVNKVLDVTMRGAALVFTPCSQIYAFWLGEQGGGRSGE